MIYSILFVVVLTRVILEVVVRLRSTTRQIKQQKEGKRKMRLMVVLGSGGHTAEMLKLMKAMDMTYMEPRCYVVASTDNMSSQKAVAFEEEYAGDLGPSYEVVLIPRSREVGQSFFTSVGSTIWATMCAAQTVLSFQPDVLLVNGPGTCLPVVLLCKAARWLGLQLPCKVFYVESIARVDHLSLTGKILYTLGITDEFFVQWEAMKKKYPSATYVGRVM